MPKRLSNSPNAKDLVAKLTSLDELLEVQSRQEFKGTIEGIEGKPGAVKITPWVPVAGCLCHMAVVVPREAIIGVMMTEDTHFCCGKTLRVVEVDFADDATIPLQDLFNQIYASGSAIAERMGRATLRWRSPSQPSVRDDPHGTPSRPFRVPGRL